MLFQLKYSRKIVQILTITFKISKTKVFTKKATNIIVK